jgi:phosphoenolpyruvate carboxykinase (GTP)
VFLLLHSLQILGITNPQGVKKYIAAAFPSQCGKTNLAMITPTLPGWKAELIGDDIAWMRFGPDGRLWAINPENGLFGVATGTNMKSNPNAMKAVSKNTIYTNVALTSDGGVFWEGLEDETPPELGITSWLGVEGWEKLPAAEKKANPAAHPNSRFCTPTVQCPNLDPDWENPRGVPIDAILFGGRRPKTIPLVFETFSWEHAIYVGLCLRSQSTAAAADHKGKKILLNDPFAMRPFFGYNFCQYMEHWGEMKQRPGAKLPKVFHVNWFRENAEGHFIWPGFGDNCRVIDWILRRCNGEDIAQETPLGLIPKPGTINMEGLGSVDMENLFDFSKADLEQETAEMEAYFAEQMPGQLPDFLQQELQSIKDRIAAMP